MGKKLTTEEFIDKANKIHENEYDYSIVEYKGSYVPVKIICPIHGIFAQKPVHHLQGSGCPECGKLKKYRLDLFDLIKKLKNIHNNKYSYNAATFKNKTTKDIIEITCPVHGPFNQRLADHLYSKAGCPQCKKLSLKDLNSKNEKDFIEQAKEMHVGKYDYSLVDYKNAHEKVKIICPEHGIFEQTPMSHLRKNGCNKCAGRQILSKEDFIKRAQEIHGDKYDYNLVEYKKLQEPVQIICPVHGLFRQTPNNHIHSKAGCPECAEYGFNPNKPATLYYLLDQETGLYKIGVTNKSVSERFPNADGSKRNMIILEQTYYENGYEALEAEQEILEAFSYCRCTNESWPEAWGGRTEFFKEDVLKNLRKN